MSKRDIYLSHVPENGENWKKFFIEIFVNVAIKREPNRLIVWNIFFDQLIQKFSLHPNPSDYLIPTFGSPIGPFLEVVSPRRWEG